MTERTKHPGRTPGRGTYETTIEDAETAAEAARLRSLGMTYRQIAAQQGVNVSTAHDRVARALAAVPVEAVATLRTVEVDRLDALTARLFVIATSEHVMVSHGRVLSGVKDLGPNLAAIRELRLISESRRKLLGLDAPIQHNVVVTDAMVAEIERLSAELGIDVDRPSGAQLAITE
jgi:hypothetical protein